MKTNQKTPTCPVKPTEADIAAMDEVRRMCQEANKHVAKAMELLTEMRRNLAENKPEKKGETK